MQNTNTSHSNYPVFYDKDYQLESSNEWILLPLKKKLKNIYFNLE